MPTWPGCVRAIFDRSYAPASGPLEIDDIRESVLPSAFSAFIPFCSVGISSRRFTEFQSYFSEFARHPDSDAHVYANLARAGHMLCIYSSKQGSLMCFDSIIRMILERRMERSASLFGVWFCVEHIKDLLPLVGYTTETNPDIDANHLVL